MHGWKWLEHARHARGPGRYSIEIAGLPEEPNGDLDEVLTHAVAAVHRVGPVFQVDSASFVNDGIDAELSLNNGDHVSLRVRAHGQKFDLRSEWKGLTAIWSWRPDEETVAVESGARSAPSQTRKTPSGAERAVRQLLDAGDDLKRAGAVLALKAAVLAKLPHRIPIGLRTLRHSAELQKAGVPLLDQLGLVGTLPPSQPVERLGLKLPTEILELWSFRAGLKRVAFLTVKPGEEAETLRPFGDVHVERLVRNVEVGAQDTWRDNRTSGDARVELYVSRDPALARRAAELQANKDPSAVLREMGDLLGYPGCCVEAFAAQPDRSNNTFNRYATAARTTSPGPWPWELNNLVFMLLAFFPCRYDCPEALKHARAALAEMGKAYPDLIAPLKGAMARPTLYFDHPRRVLLKGNQVLLPDDAPPELEPLASTIASAKSVVLTDVSLNLGATSLSRTDPGLGFLAPFA